MTASSGLRYADLARRVREHFRQEHRYAHIVRVARMADVLAQRHGLDAAKARTAGMLHDLARLYSSQRLIDECRRRAMPIDVFELANPVVLHARLGAELAREDFGIDDPEILSAIAKHTLGSGAMSPLDCVVYLADGLEPGRDFPERAALAALAQKDLKAAMAATMRQTMRYLERQGIPAAPQTAAAARSFGVETREA
ncbi:MAG TPA: bis(5'-nucleosyl)-tetraphosphatase (symmetrical) YqeK [Verrucomicrobiae bacterium]|jgi:predicted HD superfamily hydrolase involved in NAD metabolism|nr:bis(5'-nucleosyl)-tetraphosphatase (symmetrical) YqeK [Verrucomicrobiae bacterium]